MIDGECVENTSVSGIKVGPESGRSAVILNPDRTPHLKIRVDNCVEKIELRADWVIEKNDIAIIIELKGRNVEHGAAQIFATAHRWKNVEGRCSKIAGLIIGRQVPAASTSMQLRRQQFAKQFGGPLHIVNKNAEFTIENLISFRGPFKN